MQKAGLGDFLMLMPTLLTIHSNKPLLKLDLLVPEEIYELAMRFNIFNSIRLFENNRKSMFKRIKSLLREIIINIIAPYDILFQPCSGPNLASYVLFTFSRAKLKIGFCYNKSFNVFDVTLNYSYEQKDVTQNTILLKYLGIDKEIIYPLMPIEFSEALSADKIIQQQKELIFDTITGGEKIIGIYPTTLLANDENSRHWGVNTFASFIDGLYGWEKNILFIFFGSAQDKYYCEQILNKTSIHFNAFILAGRVNLFESCAVAKHCNLVIGIDGGFMHCVNLMKIESIVIWKSTSYKNHGYDNNYTINLSLGDGSGAASSIKQKSTDHSSDAQVAELLKLTKNVLSGSTY